MPTLTKVYEVIVSGLVGLTGGGSKRVENVFHFHQTTSGPPVNPGDVANQFVLTYWPDIADQLSVDWLGEFASGRLLDDAESQAQNAITVPQSGAITGDRLPNDMAFVFLRRTGTRGRSFRGSKHFGPLGESQTTKDELSTTAVAAISPLGATSLLGTLTVSGETLVHCLVSKFLSQLRTNPTTIIGADVTQNLLNKTIGTMRRRREKTIR